MKRPDKFDRMGRRWVDKLSSYQTIAPQLLAALLRRVDRAAEHRGWDAGYAAATEDDAKAEKDYSKGRK